MRPVAAILENVWACWMDDNVMRVIRRVCLLLGWTHKLHKMSLQTDWVIKRTRGWMLMGPPDLIQNIEQLPPPGDVMTSILEWPTAHKQELAITEEDLQMFQTTNMATLVLDLHHQPNTLLHSLGSLRDPCPCGCRQGISDQRLKQRGISTLVIQEEEGYRYVHPAEAALLQGAVIPTQLHQTMQPIDFKLTLTQLGQLASPLHSGCLAVQLHANMHHTPRQADLKASLTHRILQG